MRTTLNIADDVLLAARVMAQSEKKPMGQVMSELARMALAMRTSQAPTDPAVHQGAERLAPYGIRPLPSRGVVISHKLIERLRDAEGV